MYKSVKLNTYRTGIDLLAVFNKAYGRYTEKPNQFMDKYNWLGDKVKFRFNYESQKIGPLAWFTDNNLNNELMTYKSEKNSKAASDL